jgi:hypothetical protein
MFYNIKCIFFTKAGLQEEPEGGYLAHHLDHVLAGSVTPMEAKTVQHRASVAVVASELISSRST